MKIGWSWKLIYIHNEMLFMIDEWVPPIMVLYIYELHAIFLFGEVTVDHFKSKHMCQSVHIIIARSVLMVCLVVVSYFWLEYCREKCFVSDVNNDRTVHFSWFSYANRSKCDQKCKQPASTLINYRKICISTTKSSQWSQCLCKI